MIELKKTQNGIEMAAREIPVFGQWDVVVVGGGMGGVGAAMAAGRRGWKTLLIESMGALGGLATMGLVNIPLDFVSGLGVEMIDELEKIDGHWHRNTDPEKHKLVLDRMLEKYGCDVLLQITVIDSIVENGAIAGVVVQTKTGPAAILARRVVDASGDSDAAFFAGARTVSGRPDDGMSQACSLEFTLGGVDWDAYLSSDLKKTDPKWIRTIRAALENGDLPYEVDNHLNWITHLPGRPQHCGRDEVSICLAHSRNCFPLRMGEMSRMFREGREQVDFLVRFIKKYIPGFENAYITRVCPEVRIRETRRVMGDYKLLREDVMEARKFDDVIGKSAFTAGAKHAVGDAALALKDLVYPKDGGSTDIPYRCLVVKDLENFMVAGKAISTDRAAHHRFLQETIVTGQAAGVAAALCVRDGKTPRQLETDVSELQKILIEQGAILYGTH